MAAPKKTVVKFEGGEFKPKRLANGLIGLRAPIDIKILPMQSIRINLDMKCNTPLLLVSRIGGSIMTGKTISIDVENDTDAVAQFKAGEVVARAYPLFSAEFEIG